MRVKFVFLAFVMTFSISANADMQSCVERVTPLEIDYGTAAYAFYGVFAPNFAEQRAANYCKTYSEEVIACGEAIVRNMSGLSKLRKALNICNSNDSNAIFCALEKAASSIKT